MTRDLVRLSGATAAAAALVLAGASAASAATWSHTDATKDVLAHTSSTDKTTAAPTNTATDITRVRAVNGARSVVVKVKTRSALPTKDFIAEFAVKTATARYDATRLNVDQMSGIVFTKGASETERHCAGLKIVIDRATSMTTFTVPSTCIGSPGWVKVGVFFVTSKADDSVEWGDDGLRTGVGNDGTFSPRIAKG